MPRLPSGLRARARVRLSLSHPEICETRQLLAATVPPLFAPDPGFATNDHIVSATVFNWYTSDSGQHIGPWRPEEGRENWTGEVSFWKNQIKEMMDANIDLLYVIEMPDHDQQRTNLFQAAGELRAEGYDVPKIAPFFDPIITYSILPPINVATTAGKDHWVSRYQKFFDAYYSVNQDPYADDYLGRMNGKPILDTWHNLPEHVANLSSLTRADVETRLRNYYGTDSIFNNGIYMVGTGINPWYPSFADERIAQFEITDYYYPVTHNGITTAQVKAGYWDQNVRNPGSILKRNGGAPYANAWNQINDNPAIKRVNIESWNEYDEGSGIYAGDTGAPYLHPGSGNVETDVWSTTNNPREYIDTTWAGAREFNDAPDYGTKFLWNDLPTTMKPGEVRTVSVVVRNTGDLQWRGADGFKLGQQELVDPVVFGIGRYEVDDAANEVDHFGGVFRGRPVTFTFQLEAPETEGVYPLSFKMVHENVAWFGEDLKWTVTVKGPDTIGTNRQGKYYLDANSNFVWNSTTGGDFLVSFGAKTDAVIVGDWNRDALDQLGVYRGTTFYLDQNGNRKWDGTAGGDLQFQFGATGDVPVAGDWNGDGQDDVGVFRSGVWYLDLNGNRKWDGVAGGDGRFGFGAATDIPVTGDWNGDGRDDLAVFRNGKWYLDQNGNRKWDAVAGGDQLASFGSAGDKPLTGDWNGDGAADLGVVRNARWYLDQNANRSWNNIAGGDRLISFGAVTDIPLAGHWASPTLSPGSVPLAWPPIDTIVPLRSHEESLPVADFPDVRRIKDRTLESILQSLLASPSVKRYVQPERGSV